MKKIILIVALFCSLSAIGQSYTYIAQRYDWLAGVFRALGLPAGDGPAAFQTGQRQQAGSVYYDSTGVDAGLYIYDGTTWVQQGSGGFFSPDQTATSNTLHEASGFSLEVDNINTLTFNSQNTIINTVNDLLLDAAGRAYIEADDSIRFTSTTGTLNIPNLIASSDTTTFKPIGRSSGGELRQLSYWPGSGGSADAYTSVYLVDDTTFALVRDDLTEDTVVISGGGSGNPNLVVQRAGSGIVQHYVQNDSLFLEDIEGDGTYTTVTKTADSTVRVSLTAIPVSYVIAASDETTDLTTGTAKVTFRMPHAMTVTAVRASINTVSSSGTPTIDINESGTTILSTKITIDVSEKTSTTAATPPVISDASLADDAEITIDIDVSGTGAKGLKVVITGTRPI